MTKNGFFRQIEQRRDSSQLELVKIPFCGSPRLILMAFIVKLYYMFALNTFKGGKVTGTCSSGYLTHSRRRQIPGVQVSKKPRRLTL